LKIPKVLERKFMFYTPAPDTVANIRLVDDAEAEGLNKDNIFSVTFRQGTIGDDNRRGVYINTRKLRNEGGEYVSISDVNQNNLGKLEMAMTISGTDLTFPDGSELEFVQAGSIRKVKSESSFDRWYDGLPPQWAKEIYGACLEVNPDWDSSKRFSELSD